MTLTVAQTAEMFDRAEQENQVRQNPLNQFWMVWREGGSRPRQRHADYDSAVKEAERIAANHPGANTYVMLSVTHFKTEAVKPPVVKTEMGA